MESFQLLVIGVMLAVFSLSALARRMPHVVWLQPFRHAWPTPSPEQRARLRRRANVYAGAQFILLGIVIFMAFFALKVMFFSAIHRSELLLVGGLSLLCIVLGTTAIVRNSRTE